MPKIPLSGRVTYWFYMIYADIVTRLTVDQDRRPIPQVPCQLCGENHKEEFCPNAKGMGILDC